jgi:recombination protein RecA
MINDPETDFNMFKKNGSWFSYGDTKLGQGRDAVKKILEDNPELAEEIKGKITEYLKEKAK